MNRGMGRGLAAILPQPGDVGEPRLACYESASVREKLCIVVAREISITPKHNRSYEALYRAKGPEASPPRAGSAVRKRFEGKSGWASCADQWASRQPPDS